MARFAWLIAIGAVLNGVLGLGLAALRLCGAIGGSWAEVLSPLWVPLAITCVLAVILLVQMARNNARYVLDELGECVLVSD